MEKSDQKVADALAQHWADHILPSALRPYARLMRLERPIGWWLLLIPGWWALAMADGTWQLFALFFMGAIIMRGAGCVWNDIADRDFDTAVARTRSRPIPSGQVSLKQAYLFLSLLLGLGLIILLQMNTLTVILGVASLALIFTYPFMKRITWWPQAFLGLTFNWGALMGFAAASGTLPLPSFFLYAGGFFWTLAYDTIYAHQDSDDDALIGVKSSARALGDKSPRWIGAFFVLSLICFTSAAFFSDAGILLYMGIIAAGAHAIWQMRKLDIHNHAICLSLFRANREFGLAILAGALLDRFL